MRDCVKSTSYHDVKYYCLQNILVKKELTELKPVSDSLGPLHGVSTIQVGQGQVPHQYEVIKSMAPPMSCPSPTYIAVPATAASSMHGSQIYTQYNGQNYGTYTNASGQATMQGIISLLLLFHPTLSMHDANC